MIDKNIKTLQYKQEIINHPLEANSWVLNVLQTSKIRKNTEAENHSKKLEKRKQTQHETIYFNEDLCSNKMPFYAMEPKWKYV